MSKISVTQHVKIEPGRKDCFWFQDVSRVATLQLGNRLVTICSLGRCVLAVDENQTLFGQELIQWAKKKKLTDRQIKKLKFDEGNWFAFQISTKGSNHIDYPTDDVISSFDEALSKGKEYLKMISSRERDIIYQRLKKETGDLSARIAADEIIVELNSLKK